MYNKLRSRAAFVKNRASSCRGCGQLFMCIAYSMAIQFHSSFSSAVNSLVFISLLVAFDITVLSSASLSLAAADSANFGPYLDVYPPVAGNIGDSDHQFSCVPSVNRSCPLYFALSMSFGGEYLSSGVIASIQYALDQINRDESLLPGYSLHYTLTDSQVSCRVI